MMSDISERTRISNEGLYEALVALAA
jgi:hypothetical protein